MLLRFSLAGNEPSWSHLSDYSGRLLGALFSVGFSGPLGRRLILSRAGSSRPLLARSALGRVGCSGPFGRRLILSWASRSCPLLALLGSRAGGLQRPSGSSPYSQPGEC